jgi:hypothetical protein
MKQELFRRYGVANGVFVASRLLRPHGLWRCYKVLANRKPKVAPVCD